MREQIVAALQTSPADYTEIRIERKDTTRVVYRGPHLETADALTDMGGIVRALYYNSGWGVATFNDLTDLPRRVQEAAQCARSISGQAPIELAPVPIAQAHITVPLDRDFRGVSLAEKQALAAQYNDLILGHDPRIQDSQVVYNDSFAQVIYANSQGALIEEDRPQVTVYLMAVARADQDVQQAAEAWSRPAGFQVALGLEDKALTAAQRAVDLLTARPVAGGRYTVVLNPRLAGVFAHEAFGHLSEADFVYDNPRAQEMMTLGRRFGPDMLTIADDGNIPGMRGTHPYDDEGTPTGRTDLIREGILVGRLHSRETAARMGETPTGNARASGYRYPPIVRMTNTFVEAGDTSFQDMIRDIDQGIYACDAYGGQTAMESFSFSAGYAYMIRDGEIAEMVRDVVLSGNLFVTLSNVQAVGDDFQWIGAGTCGKGQGGLAVGIGAPHLRIGDVLIGGQ
ncbi:MAG: TldD/PmbA family protein [Chloroflexi bacterium]|nr:TldD/PmbA family protein [Chloroflexota bacterium]MBU1747884.1 TldD/PmbA family protein [Chloroflexota bacterium]